MDHQEYAGFWPRLGATMIDVISIMVVTYPILWLIYGDAYFLGEVGVYGVWDIVIGYVLPVVATIWFWLRFLATPGKILLKLKVVDASTGEKMTLGQSIIRYFAYIVSTIPLCLGFVWVAIDPKKQAWHDKIAKTVVVRDHKPTAHDQ